MLIVDERKEAVEAMRIIAVAVAQKDISSVSMDNNRALGLLGNYYALQHAMQRRKEILTNASTILMSSYRTNNNNNNNNCIVLYCIQVFI